MASSGHRKHDDKGARSAEYESKRPRVDSGSDNEASMSLHELDKEFEYEGKYSK